MINLDSGVVIDGKTGLVIFPIGESLVLKFTFEEWTQFVEMVGDANLIFEANTDVNTYQCGACGAVNSTIDYEEPSEGDLN